MKKPKAYSVIGLLFISLTLALAAAGGSTSHAWFFDRDAENAEARMATVDIELGKQSFANGAADFTVNNNSNIDIYLRAGIIFEVKTPDTDSEWAIADISGINVTQASEGWRAVQKVFSDKNGNEYKKWFLEYAEAAVYTPVSSDNKQLDVTFNVTGAPSGYDLVVNIVPEAVQAGNGSAALNYLENHEYVNPPW